MREVRSIVRFGLLAGVSAAVLLTPFEPFERAYAGFFRGANNVLFARFWVWGDGKVSFIDMTRDGVVDRIAVAVGYPLPAGFPVAKRSRVQDTLMVFQNRSAKGHLGQAATSSRALGWWPTALTISLLAASPAGWRRRLYGLLWGLGLIHVFIALRLTLTIAYTGFAAPGKGYALFAPSDGAYDVLRRLEEVLVQDPTVSFVAPVFIWLLICMLNGTLTTFRPMGEEPPVGDGTAP